MSSQGLPDETLMETWCSHEKVKEDTYIRPVGVLVEARARKKVLGFTSIKNRSSRDRERGPVIIRYDFAPSSETHNHNHARGQSRR